MARRKRPAWRSQLAFLRSFLLRSWRFHWCLLRGLEGGRREWLPMGWRIRAHVCGALHSIVGPKRLRIAVVYLGVPFAECRPVANPQHDALIVRRRGDRLPFIF